MSSKCLSACPTWCYYIKKRIEPQSCNGRPSIQNETLVCERIRMNKSAYFFFLICLFFYPAAENECISQIKGRVKHVRKRLSAEEELPAVCLPHSGSRANSRQVVAGGGVNYVCCCDERSETLRAKERKMRRREGGREGKKNVFLNQVKCLNWPVFVYRRASEARSFPQ